MKNETNFWLERPTMMGIRGWSLFIPSVASAVGFFVFAALAFGFTELDMLPEAYRRVMVLVGAFSLAFGSEVGTLSSITEIYRKGERLGRWDALALVISIMSTIGAFVLSFATLLGAKASWSSVVQLYGPIILGVLSGLDSYSNFLEFGLYLNTYDKRLTRWEKQYSEHLKEQMQQRLEHEKLLSEHRLQLQLEQMNTKKVSLTDSTEQKTPTIEQARETKVNNDALQQAQRFEHILSTFSVNPGTPITELADTLSVSRNTVYRDIAALKEQGKLHKNGRGYVVEVQQ